jgi:hypothetical protein
MANANTNIIANNIMHSNENRIIKYHLSFYKGLCFLSERKEALVKSSFSRNYIFTLRIKYPTS